MFPFCVALDEDPLEVLNQLFLQAICIALLRSLYASGPLATRTYCCNVHLLQSGLMNLLESGNGQRRPLH